MAEGPMQGEEQLVWETYFGGREYDPQFDKVARKFGPFFERVLGDKGGAEYREASGRITLHFRTLAEDAEMGGMVAEAISQRPTDTLACMEFAAHRVLSRRAPLARRVHVRIIESPTRTKLKRLKANLIDRFFATRGTVVRVGNIRPLITRMTFECAKCGCRETRHFEGGKFSPPTSCPNSGGPGGCRSRTFHPDRDGCSTIDWQKIRLQEIIDDDREAGRIPRTVDVDLTNDLVDDCVPGDIVTICGIVRSIKTEEDRGGSRAQAKALYYLFLEANSLVNTKKKERESEELTQNDQQMIKMVAEEANPLRLLVNSLCPSIFGQEMVKAGLVLCMVSGVGKYQNGEEKNRLAIRGDPHMLVVGDPGLGKSQMLRAAASVHPRGVYVCGNTASAAGLTVTLVRDPQTGDHALEAGALVLADQGLCVIDEFDKISSDHSSLLEAMEQQSISMAKAGMICSLSARCSMVAAANPVGGHYDKAKTVCENIKMSAALLSRFDLTFILLDNPDERHDEQLSEHVISMHSNSGKAREAPNVRRRRSETDRGRGTDMLAPSSKMGFDDDWRSEMPDENRLSLSQQLCYSDEEAREGVDLLPHECFQKYVRYVRSNVRPTLSADAIKVLQDYYLDMRRKYTTDDATPVTTRQLESLIRLTQARAKVDHADTASKEHAAQVVELMEHSMREVCLDEETGSLDFARGAMGGGMSKSGELKRFLSALEKAAQSKKDSMFQEFEMDEIAQKIGIMQNFREMLEKLNTQGMLLRQGGGKWKLPGSSYDITASQRRQST